MTKPRRPREGSRLVSFTLRLGALLAFVLRPFGVDRARFLALLEVRLLEDIGRGRSAAAEQRPGMFHGGMVMTLVMYLLFGVFLALVLFHVGEPLAALTLVLGVVMIFVTMTLASEHIGTLFETTDLDVLGPLPVDGRTVLASRVAHTLLYFLLLVGSLGLLPLVAGTMRFGWPFAPTFVLALALATANCFGLALLLLVSALRFVAPARVRSVLLFLQIGGALIAFASMQILPMLGEVPTAWLVAHDSWWPWLLPPAHGAALVVSSVGSSPVLLDGLPAVELAVPPPQVGLVVLAFAAPCCLLGAIALMASSFQSRLAGMASSERGTVRPARRAWLRDRLLRSDEARAGYDFLAALTARERQFRMRTWPGIALAWFLAGWCVFRSSSGTGGGPAPAMACTGLYVVGVMMPQILLFTRFSDHWQARWLFRIAPLRSPAMFVHGAVVALAARFVLPVILLTLVVVLIVGGLPIVLDALYAALVVALLSLLALLHGERHIPFTRKFHPSEVSGALGRTLLFLHFAAALALLHTLVRRHTAALVGLSVAMAVLVVLQVRALARSLHQPARVKLDWDDERDERIAKRA